MQKVCLYLEELASVQRGPAAPQTEPTDVVVTDISLLRLPPVRPYEYLQKCWNVCCKAATAIDRILPCCIWGVLAVFESVTLIIHYAQWGIGSKLMNKTL